VYQNRRVKVTAQPADSVIRLTHKNASAKVTCATSTGGCTSADVAGEDVVCGRGQTWRLPYLHNVFLSKTPRAHDRPPDLRVFYVAAVKIARGHHHRLSTIKSRSVPFARIKYYSGTAIFTIWCAINKKKNELAVEGAIGVVHFDFWPFGRQRRGLRCDWLNSSGYLRNWWITRYARCGFSAAKVVQDRWLGGGFRTILCWESSGNRQYFRTDWFPDFPGNLGKRAESGKRTVLIWNGRRNTADIRWKNFDTQTTLAQKLTVRLSIGNCTTANFHYTRWMLNRQWQMLNTDTAVCTFRYWTPRPNDLYPTSNYTYTVWQRKLTLSMCISPLVTPVRI
jgi:hypothetical protein